MARSSLPKSREEFLEKLAKDIFTAKSNIDAERLLLRVINAMATDVISSDEARKIVVLLEQLRQSLVLPGKTIRNNLYGYDLKKSKK